MKKRILAFILAFFVLFGTVFLNYEKASATGLEGAIIGGVGAVASVLTAPEVFVVGGLVLGAAISVDFVTSNWDSISSGATKAMNTVAAASGMASDAVSNWWSQAEKGIIDTSSDLWEGFCEFTQEFCTEHFEITSGNKAVNVFDSQCVFGLTNGGAITVTEMTSLSPVYFVCSEYTSSGYWVNLVSEQPFSYTKTYKYANGNVGSTMHSSGSKQSEYYIISFVVQGLATLPVMLKDAFSSWLIEFANGQSTSNSAVATPYGILQDVARGIDDSKIGVQVPSGVIDVRSLLEKIGAVDVPGAVGDVVDKTITYPDVIDAIEGTPWVIDGDTEEEDVPKPVVVDPSIPYPDCITDEEKPTVPDKPDNENLGGVAVDGLEKIFPFCIPFDIYHLFSVFCAEPTAPKIDWKFTVLEKEFDLSIDLSKFDSVASLLRDMLIIVFCVGLALKTRDLIRG